MTLGLLLGDGRPALDAADVVAMYAELKAKALLRHASLLAQITDGLAEGDKELAGPRFSVHQV